MLNQDLAIAYYISAVAITEDGEDYTWREFMQAKDYVTKFSMLMRDNEQLKTKAMERLSDYRTEVERLRSIPLPLSSNCPACTQYNYMDCAVCREKTIINPRGNPSEWEWFGTTERR